MYKTQKQAQQEWTFNKAKISNDENNTHPVKGSKGLKVQNDGLTVENPLIKQTTHILGKRLSKEI